MSAMPPAQASQPLSQQGSVSTARQLWPLGQPEPSAQSAAGKQPAVNWDVPQAGTSQRHVLSPMHPAIVAYSWQNAVGGQVEMTICQTPIALQMALAPHPLRVYGHSSAQHGLQAEPSTGTSAGQAQAGQPSQAGQPPPAPELVL